VCHAISGLHERMRVTASKQSENLGMAACHFTDRRINSPRWRMQMPACEIERQLGGMHAGLRIPASVLSSRVCSFAMLQ
jgi:hypothetical protein